MPAVSLELLILLVSLFFTLFCNGGLWRALLARPVDASAQSWLFLAAVFVVITAIHCLLLGLVTARFIAKPLLIVLMLGASLAAYYMQRYTIFFDVSMMQNVLHTDTKEAGELLSLSMIGYVALRCVPAALLLWCVPIAARSWRSAIWKRALFLLVMVLVAVGASLAVFQELSSLMRNQRELRYLVTPANVVVSTLRALADNGKELNQPRIPIGEDAKLAPDWGRRTRPAVLVLVVGETARAANWGMDGYARQTAPQLAQLPDLLNFPQATSCGANTETSVPCMFSPYGRHDYNEKRMRTHENLLNVLERAGIKTIWRDNQSGCKGVCDGLETERLSDSTNPAYCADGRCMDGILLDQLGDIIDKHDGSLVIVLHQLGSHGPAYFARYPPAFRQFTPTCDTSDLGKCQRQDIVNAYDNTLLYTDDVLARLIGILKTQKTHDAAMWYMSDHGESLGENGIYLHGMPYAIAPRDQTWIPMVMWMSPGFADSFGVDMACMRQQADKPVSHDDLFHTVLGLLQVRTQVYDGKWDISAACRK